MSRPLALLALLAAGAAIGQQPVRQTPLDATLCWGGTVHSMAVAPKERFGTYAVTGGLRSADAAFQSMSIECIGVYEARASFESRGYCVFVDAAGDKAFGTDASGPHGYTWQFLGGTGKFAGIAGGGTIERLGNAPPVRDGTLQGCRRIVGHYTLPGP